MESLDYDSGNTTSPGLVRSKYDEFKILLVESGINNTDPIRYTMRRAIKESTRKQKIVAFCAYVGLSTVLQTVFPEQFNEIQCNSPMVLTVECPEK
jgi:hypothetical protein